MNNEKIGSRLGFILLSAGCAIGCGNVWKFPWMVGQNGGGAFVLIYIIFLVLLGLPVMTMEFAIGRAAQSSPVRIYHNLTPEKKLWRTHGYVALIANVCLMSFYTTVTGWLIYYFVSFLKGSHTDLTFISMISNPKVNVLYLFIAVAFGFAFLTFGIQKGLERISKYMMVALLLLMIVLAIKSATFPGAGAGYKFYLLPDFSKINLSVCVAAMNQAFFTLSVGIGSMAIFGSYIGKEHSLLGESVNIIILDTFVAIVSGLIIFPSCASLNLEVTAGPSLLFDTMANVFRTISYGRIWGTLFFLFMVFAAFSTELAVFENILACVRELTSWSRVKGCIICGIVIFVLSLTTALGFSVLHFQPFAEGSTWLDFWDFLVSTNFLPLGSLVIALFCNSKKLGWGWENLVKEANEGSGLKVKNWMRPVFAIIVPIMILFIYIYGLVTFGWK